MTKHEFCRRISTWPIVMLIMLAIALPLPALAATGDIYTVAGSGVNGFSGDGGPATSAQMVIPKGVAADGAGNLYIADTGNHRIRKVDAVTGIINTVAGNGVAGFGGDGGPATNAQLSSPSNVAVDGAGNLYIADTNNHRVRKVDAGGSISTVAGVGSPSYGGDGGPAVAAPLNNPNDVAVDGDGNLFITDTNNHRIRKVGATNGVISTVAGNGFPGFVGDGGPALVARLYNPSGVAVDGAGNLYIADINNQRIRKVTTGSGVISTVAGNGSGGFSGDGGLAVVARLLAPSSVAVDSAGNLYIADTNNHRIRKVAAGSGVISTVAGNGSAGIGGDGGPAVAAYLLQPVDVAVDGAGSLLIAEPSSRRIRMVESIAAATNTPNLHIPDAPIDAAGGSFSVPLYFAANGANVAALGFSLDYDDACLSFDAADANSDGIPDAVSGLPAGFAASISHDGGDTQGELDVSLFDDIAPITTLTDGVLFTLTFEVDPTCITEDGISTTAVTINFAATPAPSFSDASAIDVAGTTLNATIPLSFSLAPTALALSNNTVNEDVAIDTTVGIFSTTDANSTDNHTYTLVAGTGDEDNASFTIVGDELRTNTLFDFAVQSSYNIRVRTTDNGALSFEETFTISVINVNDAPVAVDDPIDPLTTIFVGGQPTVIDVLANDTDVDGDTLSVNSVDTTGTQGSVTNNGSDVSYTAPAANGSDSFTYQASDGALSSNSATVATTYVKNDGRGDCNANGNVTAADFIATVLEIFDSNDDLYLSNPAWWLIYTGDFAGSPRGCDANASENGVSNSSDSVTAADITCTVLIFFGASCSAPTAAAVQSPQTAQVAVADANVAAGQPTVVRVTLASAAHSVASASFALVLDSSQVSFDASDRDGDGAPDAVVVTVPPGVSQSVQWNAAQSRLEVALFGTSLPLPILGDGDLVNVTLHIADGAAPGAIPLSLQLVSLGDAVGQDVAVTTHDGLLTIVNTGGSESIGTIFLPLVSN